MAMQLIKQIETFLQSENLKLWVRFYSVIPFNGDSGLIEFIPNTRTVSYLKEKSQEKTLRRIYLQMFGSNFEEAILNFIESLAGYSLIQYLFQIKDRHNNNILIDTQGHIIHIDFSFLISSSPGNINFERAPFKLTSDYIELMEGKDSDLFQHYRMLFLLGLKFIRKYKKEIMDTVVLMSNCTMKCFQKFDREAMEKRFHENATDEELEVIVDRILSDAYSSYTTSNYDRYQWYTNFIYS
jgi:phosphatidylinositol 4-kinase